MLKWTTQFPRDHANTFNAFLYSFPYSLIYLMQNECFSSFHRSNFIPILCIGNSFSCFMFHHYYDPNGLLLYSYLHCLHVVFPLSSSSYSFAKIIIRQLSSSTVENFVIICCFVMHVIIRFNAFYVYNIIRELFCSMLSFSMDPITTKNRREKKKNVPNGKMNRMHSNRIEWNSMCVVSSSRYYLFIHLCMACHFIP